MTTAFQTKHLRNQCAPADSSYMLIWLEWHDEESLSFRPSRVLNYTLMTPKILTIIRKFTPQIFRVVFNVFEEVLGGALPLCSFNTCLLRVTDDGAEGPFPVNPNHTHTKKIMWYCLSFWILQILGSHWKFFFVSQRKYLKSLYCKSSQICSTFSSWFPSPFERIHQIPFIVKGNAT